MHNKNILHLVISLYPILGILFFTLFMLSNRPARWTKSAFSDSQPIVPAMDYHGFATVTDFYVHDKWIYVLYGRKGLLKIYDTEGDYVRSYAYNLKNHSALLYEYDDKIYLDSALEWVCVFEKGVYIEKIGYDQWEPIQNKVPQRYSAVITPKKRPDYYGEIGYTLVFGSIRKCQEDGGIRVVIPRPYGSLFFQGILPLLVMFLWIVSCFGIQILKVRH